MGRVECRRACGSPAPGPTVPFVSPANRRIPRNMANEALVQKLSRIMQLKSVEARRSSHLEAQVETA